MATAGVVDGDRIHADRRVVKLLAFETATEACSVAVWVDGAVHSRFEVAPRRHAELALPWAEALLAEAGVTRAQLDAVAVGRGPGAFTGVRLGVALAQGIALALDRPVVPVSTLAVLALRGLPPDAPAQTVLASIDARMGEVYAAAFDWTGDALVPRGAEVLGTPAGVVVPGLDPASRPLRAVGTGLAAGEGALRARLPSMFVDAAALPHAADLARLAAAAYARGEALPAERLEPAYLRNAVALTLAEQQAARAARS